MEHPHEEQGGQLLDLGSQPGSRTGDNKDDMGFSFWSSREKSYTNTVYCSFPEIIIIHYL